MSSPSATPDPSAPKPSAPTVAEPSPTAPGHRTAPSKNRTLFLLCGAFILCGLAWLAYWAVFLRHSETTDDAYVAGNVIRIYPQLGGNIQDVLVDDTDFVRTGQLLVRLDPTDAQLALDHARADLAATVRQARSLLAEHARLQALVEQRKKELERTQGDLQRRKDRKTRFAVSDEELSHARDDFAIAVASLRVAEEDMRRNQMLLKDTPVEALPLVRQKAQLVKDAWLNLRRCEIVSPVDGYVARRSAQAGSRAATGMALMAIVPLDDIWVDANYKEVQLARMRPGQNARVTADIYGGKVTYSGRVTGFSAGTGSSFSLLPPENATGNWIKVVQRVPVRITLDPEELLQKPLLIGLSCTVTIDLSDQTGSLFSPPSAINADPGGESDGEHAGAMPPRYTTPSFSIDFSPVEREIDAIITAN